MKLVKQCQDLYGDLSISNQRLLTQMLESPSEEIWFKARKIVISPNPIITLEMAVKRITNGSLNEPPDPFTIYRALRYSIEKAAHFKNRQMGVAF
ncbi:MAG: hypothetical protein OEX00_10875 [Gammaproteobacteria bacterium]|nr:hypothetical protein [Gammaproteobacteria bacterium]MDH5693018.1 hypothetical protein [Gammaproteobacteria bacterium]